METQMNAVERIKQYVDRPPEENPQKHTVRPPKNWPSQGIIEFQNIKMRYAPDKPFILTDISATIQAREKIGIVGRTGSGKSSLMQVLYRLVEPESGKIMIDGLDTSLMPLKNLRKVLCIIPQEPIMFTGTVRYNLDPFSRYTDGEIWDSLQLVSLKTHILYLPKRLDDEVTEHGSNFSIGQRQLICMARALLQKPKILLMDEATASVDMETDKIIQNTIRSSFLHSTLLVIAHRINTIIDLDRVMVLDNGRLVEFDTPRRLIEMGGLFASLINATGEASATFLRNLAFQHGST
eukprot:TRINITY_DN6942_c0_g1_i8.p1 TRINITY_DN6942_c0_g1~~TRINITY_DN6942_c0_g1_i8.p1  ORF type:complete len:294 (+),score=62.13 TRINITY_DN6942_c0_g1_i8:381-1262(+)